MSNQAQDTFSTSGRGTPNAWSPSSVASLNWSQLTGTATMQMGSGAAQLTGDTSINVMTLGPKNFYWTDVICTLRKHVYTTSTMGVLARVTAANTYYLAAFTSGTLTLSRMVNGVSTALGTATFSEAVNTGYSVRLRVSGMISNTVQAKVWLASGTEPTSFQITASDSAITAPGTTGVYGQCHASDEILNYATLFQAADPPTYSTQLGNTNYGINIVNNPATNTTGALMLRDAVNAGYTWVRWILGWKNIETSPGIYDWTVPDGLVNSIVAQAGMNLLFSVTNVPSWVKYNPCSTSTYQVADPQKSATFCAALAARYNQSSSIGFVAGIEVGNEAYEKGYLNCPPGDVSASLMQYCYPAIKAVSPTCIVGGPAFYMGTTLIPWWLGAYYQAGGGPYVDFLSVHYYPSPKGPDDSVTPPLVTFLQGISLIRSTSQQYGYIKKVWLTENSWAINSNIDEPTQSADYQAILTDCTQSNIVEKHFWFDIGSITSGSGPSEKFRQAYTMVQNRTYQPPTWTIHLAPALTRHDGTGAGPSRRSALAMPMLHRDGQSATATRRDMSVSATATRHSATAISTSRRSSSPSIPTSRRVGTNNTISRRLADIPGTSRRGSS